ncbi:Uncharacterised protein, partial [Mycoplasma putrefaciens]
MSFVTIVFVLTLNFTSGRISGLLVRANQTTNHKLKEVFSNLFKAETYKNW